ncbi:MAG: chromate transporter, partial [Pseudomonadota bacterium]
THPETPEALRAYNRAHSNVAHLCSLVASLVMLALALSYAIFGANPVVQALFLGVKATVVIIVLQALLKVAGKAFKTPLEWAIAAFAFLSLFAIGLPYPLVITIAALAGLWLAKGDGTTPPAPPPLQPLRTALTIAIGLALWAAPILLAMAANQTLLTEIGLFFSKLAVVTFGGAYAVLGYMTQEVVQDYGWLTTAEMMDGLGLAETTPGPLILVSQFVGTLATHKDGGIGLAIVGSALTLWVTFVPCFLWIFAGAPYVEWLTHQPRLQGALSGITAAVVGVIAHLSLWFAFHVFFTDLNTLSFGSLSMTLPVLSSIHWIPTALAAVAAYLLLWRKLSLPTVLLLLAVAGAGLLGFTV